MHKEWGKEDLLEVRQKLDPFIPEFVFGIREDIFNIRPDVMLAGTPFSTPEKLKVFISNCYLFFFLYFDKLIIIFYFNIIIFINAVFFRKLFLSSRR